MTTVLIVPGWHGSEPEHWQSRWEADMPEAIRVEQADWDRPHLVDWLRNLEAAVTRYPGSILVTHSLGCILLAHFVDRHPDGPIKAAMVVSPPDTDELADKPLPEAIAGAAEALKDFSPIPRHAFPFPTVVVASENDPYVSIDRARLFANWWNADFIDVGEEGHINLQSHIGDWTEGKAILEDLMRRL